MIRESSDLDHTSEDDELSGDLDDGGDIIGAMLSSKDRVDQALVDVYKVRKARELLHLGEMTGLLDPKSSTLSSDLILGKARLQKKDSSHNILTKKRKKKSLRVKIVEPVPPPESFLVESYS